jgi:predicted DNA binding protein
MNLEKPVLFEVEINHLCWFCELTERRRDTSIVSTMSSVNGNAITNIVQISSGNIESDIEFIKSHRLVKSVDVLLIQPGKALLRVVSSYEAMTYDVLQKANVSLVESPLSQDGVDSEILIAKTHDEMGKVLNLWQEREDYFDVKLKKKRFIENSDAEGLNVFSKSGFFELKSAKELLSSRQLEIFRLACDYGYYEMPKKISIRELSEKTGIAPSTIAEHLRKAEKKLLPILGKILRKI